MRVREYARCKVVGSDTLNASGRSLEGDGGTLKVGRRRVGGETRIDGSDRCSRLLDCLDGRALGSKWIDLRVTGLSNLSRVKPATKM